MTEREKLMEKLSVEHSKECGGEFHCDFDPSWVAEFILADRKAVLERVRKPLEDIKREDQTRTDGWVTDYQLWQAVDKALEEIDRAMDKPME